MLIRVNREARRAPGANIDSFEAPKDFVRKGFHAIDGRSGDPKAHLTTAAQPWKNFTAGWPRAVREKIEEVVVLTQFRHKWL